MISAQLLQDIEIKRNEMIRLALLYGLTDKRVIKLSTELDILVNEVQRLSFPIHKQA